MPGEVMDRYGYEGGKMVSPKGTSFESRSLPPEYLTTKPYRVYEVLKPVETNKSIIAPWFGQKGLGIQYELPVSIDILLKRKFIKDVTP